MYLSEANLVWAYLGGASLTWAYLRGAYLTGANLVEANLGNAIGGGTTFADVDLGVAEGLDAVNHRAPSSIGIGTVYCSTGRIPEVFLRGAAASEHFITYVGSLLGETNRFYACFISYSSKHQACAERQHADLRSKGMRCWFPPENMTTRDEMAPCLHTAIGEHDKLLVVLSAHSIGSDWVKHEVDAALDQEREQNRTGLFSVRLDDAAMGIQVGWPAIIRNSRYIGDFRQWKDGDAYQKALGRLLRDLEAE